MIENKKIIALIPARSGSKGLPGKNLQNLAGKPLISWTIETARQCTFIDKIIVSTEDEEIARVARNAGAEVPFMRPHVLATDDAKGFDVVLHCINWFEKNNSFYDILLLLQPTSPLRSPLDIENALKRLFEKDAGSIISVCAVEHHPYWSNELPENLSMKNFIKPEATVNRQDLPVFYRLNGAIYLAFTDYFKKQRGFFGTDTYAYIMPSERSVDIDSLLDLQLAEIIKKSE